jgi:tRNA modification GTPase
LGEADSMPDGALLIAAKCDLGSTSHGMPVSTVTGEGLAELRSEIAQRAKALLPKPGSLALNARHRVILAEVEQELESARGVDDLLVSAEHLRSARMRLDALTGKAGVENMLDALFGAFCIGK